MTNKPSMIYSVEEALTEKRRLGIRIDTKDSITSMSDQMIADLKTLMAIHGAICLVNQSLQPEELQSFVSRWGDVVELTGGLAFENQEKGLPSITRVGNVRPDGSIIPDVHFAEYWHHDGDFWQPGQHFVVNFLSSAVVPIHGGKTGFFDSRRAYDLLSAIEREQLDGATITVRASEISDFQDARPDEIPPDAHHDVIVRHPMTGEPALYMPDSSTGVEAADGSALGAVADWIDPLLAQMGMYQHDWAVDDLLIFDNLQTMHRGMGGYGDKPRLLYRCQARM